MSGSKLGDLLHFGKAVALVDLTSCRSTDNPDLLPLKHERAFGDYSHGRFAWFTSNLQNSFEPFDVSGRQGLFDAYFHPESKWVKAISLWEPWASLMRTGAKTIETRSWFTSYRGPLLICAAKKKDHASLSLLEDPVFRAGLMREVPRG